VFLGSTYCVNTFLLDLCAKEFPLHLCIWIYPLCENAFASILRRCISTCVVQLYFDEIHLLCKRIFTRSLRFHWIYLVCECSVHQCCATACSYLLCKRIFISTIHMHFQLYFRNAFSLDLSFVCSTADQWFVGPCVLHYALAQKGHSASLIQGKMEEGDHDAASFWFSKQQHYLSEDWSHALSQKGHDASLIQGKMEEGNHDAAFFWFFMQQHFLSEDWSLIYLQEHESYRTYEGVMSHVWMRRVTNGNASGHTYACIMSRVDHTGLCLTYKCAVSHL